MRDKDAVASRIKGSVSSKQYGYEDLLAPIIAGRSSVAWGVWGVGEASVRAVGLRVGALGL